MGSNTAGTGVKPEVASEDEIRFAVVMYGGVSLAIYINGVAQELFNMVCATAPQARGGGPARLGSAELKSSQRVYRKIGQFASQWSRLHRDRATLNAENQTRYDALTKTLKTAGCGDQDLADAPIRTRFIVDVLSGTSAGGINSIYLAKALANTQGLEGIKKLWISAGDMATLINDHISIADLPGMTVAKPPKSLLNSHRMYRKLLDALAGMRSESVGPAVAEGEASSLVEELDLFITTTDIRGLTLPITLTDKIVYEKRHRNVFHFRYAHGGAENDFVFANDPFLAYAARCTSSFPFAFEPMALADIETFSHPAYPGLSASNPRWRKFYSEYWRSSLIEVERSRLKGNNTAAPADIEAAQELLQKQFLGRAFGDGGYLDNKPFSYATSKLMRRRADLPVRRKLLYVEPVPQHPELEKSIEMAKPDFAENIRAALLDLPTKEMIREDIERVLDRNRLLQRISAYAREVDGDMARIVDFEDEEERQAQPVSVMLNRYGISYGAYHRIRIDDTSTRVAGALARAAGFDPRTSACLAVREVVNKWRMKRFQAEGADPSRLETRFLYDFDLQYPLRRLSFVSRRINELALLDNDAKHLLHAWAERVSEDASARKKFSEHLGNLAWGDAFRAELGRQKKLISDDRAAWRALDESIGRQKLVDLGIKLDINWEKVVDILELPEQERETQLSALVDGNARFDSVADYIRSKRKELGLQFRPGSDAAPFDDPVAVARACISFYFGRYALYDLVTFPVQYGTDSGEANEIEVFRVSPEDATLMIDERNGTRRKLAGTAVMNFGAFLEESWRRNDMLWGRLDAVERIVQAAMPVDKGDEVATDVRNSLIREAQAAILQEDVSVRDRDVLNTTLVRYLSAGLPAFPSKHSQLAALKESLQGRELSNAMHAVIQSCLNEEGKLWEYYRDSYSVDRSYNAEQAVRSIARATAVTGHMLQALAQQHRVNDRPFAWLSTFGAMFWGMVEVAVPQSLWNLLWRHWIGVLYLIDLAVIGGGILLTRPDLTKLGWVGLAATIGVHAAVTVVGFYIGGPAKKWFFAIPKLLLKVGLAALIGGGVLFFAERAKGLLGRASEHQEALFFGTAGVILALLFLRDVFAALKRYGKRVKN